MTTENNVAAQAGDEPMRKAFDAWAQDYFFYDKCRQDGEYVHPDMHTHWLAYKAGQVSPRATADVEREKLPHGHRDDFYLMANARNLAMEPIHRIKGMPNWVLAKELFATGSTSAHEICVGAGIDPDSYSVERATTKPGA